MNRRDFMDPTPRTTLSGYAAGNELVAVVLDLVDPGRAAGRLLGGCWQARGYEA
jgi:hypothetical protein